LETKDVYNGQETNYCATIGNLSQDAIDAIEETFGAVGPTNHKRIKFKDNLDFGQHMKVSSQFPIIPKDMDGNSYEGRTTDIGYGSVVGVVLKGDRKGNPRIASMTVLELVEPPQGESASDNDFL
jgi:hypothetical protein